MSWTYIDTIPGIVTQGGDGPNPSDAVTFALKFATDLNTAPTDGVGFALVFPEVTVVPTDGLKLAFGLPDTTVAPVDNLLSLKIGLADQNAVPTDGLNLGVGFSETSVVPTDGLGLAFTFADSTVIPADALPTLRIGFTTDSNAVPTDTVALAAAFSASDTNTAPTDILSTLRMTFGTDNNSAPTDTKTGTLRAWLSGSVQSAGVVTNPANANSANNATIASMTTAALGTNPIMTSACGVGIPAATTFASAIYRGWFQAVVPLETSHCIIVCQSTSALFTDITMIDTTAALNHLAGTFTFDLAAAGVNTLAKLQSVRIVHKSTDAVAGVSPATFTVDAGCVELAGVI